MVLQCRQCSSTALDPVSETAYRCRYCGSMTVTDGTQKSGMTAQGQQARRIVPSRAIAIGLATLTAAGVIAGVIAFRSVRQTATIGASRDDTSRTSTGVARPLHETGGDAIEKETPPRAEYRGVSVIPDVIGNVYFAGLYHNSGTVPIRTPSVTVVLFGADGRKLATGKGYAIREALLPGEETPVVVLVSKAPRYARYEVSHTPEPPYPSTNKDRPAMTIRRVALARNNYGGWEITGEIVNASRKSVKFVNVVAVVLDAGKKIVGTGTDYIREDTLAPGDYSPFRISASTVTGAPASCRIDYEARAVQ